MAKFQMKHAFNLQSAGGKLMQPGQYFSTEDEAQIAELREFAKDGSCKELVPEVKQEEKPAEKTVDAQDDITLVKGIGKKLAEKLAEKGITTKSGLKAKMADPEVEQILGLQYEKIAEQLK